MAMRNLPARATNQRATNQMDAFRAPSKRMTIGELVVQLTDETSRFVYEEEEVYRVVAHMLSDILFRSRLFSKRWQ